MRRDCRGPRGVGGLILLRGRSAVTCRTGSGSVGWGWHIGGDDPAP